MQVAAPAGAAPAAGLYGKIPAQGDFVRVSASDPLARAFSLWLEQGSEPVRRRGVKTGPRPVRFLFHVPGSPRAMAGVMGESRDKVGREFPLAVFALVDAGAAARALSSLPEAVGAFLDGAEAIVAEAPSLAAADLPSRLAGLPAPDARTAERESAAGREGGEAEPARALLERLFGDLSRGQQLYAMHCLRSACAPARGGEPPVARAVLDCPVRTRVDRWAWLEIAGRLLRWSVPPSFFWRDGEAPRLLLSVGPPPPSLFGPLCDDPAGDARLWPLSTPVAAAVEAARKALGPSLVQELERPTRSVAALVGAVAEGG